MGPSKDLYTCGHCGAKFKSREPEPRCPKCLRISKIKKSPPSATEDEKPTKNLSTPPKQKTFPWLPVGVAMMAVAGVASLTLNTSKSSLEESLGEAVVYALLGGTGLGLVAISYLKSRKR